MTLERIKRIYDAMNGDWEKYPDVTIEDIIDLRPADTLFEFIIRNNLDTKEEIKS